MTEVCQTGLQQVKQDLPQNLEQNNHLLLKQDYDTGEDFSNSGCAFECDCCKYCAYMAIGVTITGIVRLFMYLCK